MAAIAATDVLNYVLTGDVRSGIRVVQSSLCNRHGAVCHANLFHEKEAIRKEAHEDYFGEPKCPERPEYFEPGKVSPWQYINHHVLDNPQKGEKAVGLALLYPTVKEWELFELFEHRCREGDFCVVHVVRNPAACFISLRQAQRTGIWSRNLTEDHRVPSSIIVDPLELKEFCREHEAMKRKVRNFSAQDVLEVPYHELLVHYERTMRKVFHFLELPDREDAAQASCRRLRNRTMRERVFNWDDMYRQSPSEVKALLDAEDMV